MDKLTLITAIAGLVFGLLGAVLGVINTWRAFDRDKIRLKVVPVLCMFESADFDRRADRFGIEVTNLSYFPVTVKEVGFTIRGSDERMTFVSSDVRGCKLPERMEPRTAFTARPPVPACDDPVWGRVHMAYARTDCGLRFTGMSPVLADVINKRRSARR